MFGKKKQQPSCADCGEPTEPKMLVGMPHKVGGIIETSFDQRFCPTCWARRYDLLDGNLTPDEVVTSKKDLVRHQVCLQVAKENKIAIEHARTAVQMVEQTSHMREGDSDALARMIDRPPIAGTTILYKTKQSLDRAYRAAGLPNPYVAG